ncbi:MAG: hypothetical protein JWM91_2422 [Rhodospirillales bacterium]|nr:hypothetical protein [Rhodospirillales bacterium]
MRRKILAFLSVIIVSTQLCGCLIYDRSYSSLPLPVSLIFDQRTDARMNGWIVSVLAVCTT